MKLHRRKFALALVINAYTIENYWPGVNGDNNLLDTGVFADVSEIQTTCDHNDIKRNILLIFFTFAQNLARQF